MEKLRYLQNSGGVRWPAGARVVAGGEYTGTAGVCLVLLAFAGESCCGSFLEAALRGCYATVAYPVARRNRYSVLIVICAVTRSGGDDVGMRRVVELASVGEPHLGLIPALDPFLRKFLSRS